MKSILQPKMDIDQKEGSTAIAAHTNSVSATNMKSDATVGTPVSNKSADSVEINQKSVVNCNNSFSAGIADSASDVPVTLSPSEQDKTNQHIANENASGGVPNCQTNDKQSTNVSDTHPSDVDLEKSVTDGKTVNNLDSSLKNDSVLSESSSRMEQTLDSSVTSEKSVPESNGKDTVGKSTANSDSLLAEMRQICNKTIQGEEAMDVDDSLTITNDEGASKTEKISNYESKIESSDCNDSNPPSSKNDVDSASKKEVKDDSSVSKDQEDSSQMLGLDESSTNMSDTSRKYLVHDCDQDLSQDVQDDVQEVECVDPFAQTGDAFKASGEESMKVDEVEQEEEKKNKNEKGSVESEGETKKDVNDEKVEGKEAGDSVEKEADCVESERNKDDVESRVVNEEEEEKRKKNDEEDVDECMEVDGKQVDAVVEKVGDKEEEEKKKEKDGVEVVDECQRKDENSSEKEVDEDCVVVLDDEDKTADDVEAGKKSGDKEENEKKGSEKKVDEVGEKKGSENEVVGLSETKNEKEVDVEAPSDKNTDKTSTTTVAEVDASKKAADKDAEGSKEAGKEKAGDASAAEIEIDEDICIIPDTVRLPPATSGQVGSTTASATTSTATETSSAASTTSASSDGKVVAKEVTSIVDRIRVVKMEQSEVKQENVVSSRPKRQAATRADAQIKATVKELCMGEGGEEEDDEADKEYEDDTEENIQLCKQCAVVKPCKFNILNKNKVVAHLCSEACAHQYRNVLLEADKARGVASGAAGGGVGGGNVHINEAGDFVRACSQCRGPVTLGESALSWETMDFCNEECLSKYQNCLGSHCAYCKKAVQQTSLGKYCVRFGYHIRQFCSSSCLEEYKRGLKVCSFCQKDISSSETGFLAPVGDKGTFKDFCTQSCMEQYDRLSNNQPLPAEMHACDVCNEQKPVNVQVLVDSKLNKLCSEVCFAAFKFVNEVTVDQCDMCHKHFDRNTLRSDNLTVFYDDMQHNFCCKTCMNAYILGKRKIVPCNWCKVKKYNFDMIKRVLETGQTLMMCSLNCLTLYKVSINAVSSRRIKCDNCGNVAQAQYHLTMSDATIRNFCTYTCVMTFQGQYSKNPITLPGGQQPPIPTGGPKRAIAPVISTKDTRASSVPVISSVTSLAATNGQPTANLLQSSPAVVNSLSPVVSSVTSGGSPVGGGGAGLVKAAAVVGSGAGTAAAAATATATALATTTGNNYVIVRERNPPKMVNKCTTFRPTTHTKGVSCRPHACAQAVQTDVSGGDGRSVIIPIPVPVYIPVPVHMYTMPVPVPIPFPLPVPVPVFIPTTRGSAQGIMKEIKRIHEKIPTDPFEAELLMMAQMVAEDKNDDGKKKKKGAEGEGSDSDSGASAAAAPLSDGGASPDRCSDSPVVGGEEEDDEEGGSRRSEDGGEDAEMGVASLPLSCELATDGADLDAELTPSTITAPAPVVRHFLAASAADSDDAEDVDDPDAVVMEQLPVKRKRGRPSWKRGGGSTPSSSSSSSGAKRGRRSTSSTSNHRGATSTPSASPAPSYSADPSLKFMLGVQAYKQWVLAKNAELKLSGGSGSGSKVLKTDVLQSSAEELSCALALFVREVRRPSGQPYAPDTVFYFCLGIQHYLLENGRIDNIFTDAYFDAFTDALNQVLDGFTSALHDAQVIVTRVEEEHLWESKQLGAHSPHVLLCTLMFFNTKYFNLVTVDDHMKLSFSQIMKHWKKGSGGGGQPSGTRNVLLRFYAAGGAAGAQGGAAASGDDSNSGLSAPPKRSKRSSYEQHENEDDPLRCPVKLYEFYLSKCPESVKTKGDLFYLQPERSCVPDSPVWYSTQALPEPALTKVLNRIKMVKEINVALLNA